jgi:hypothetical protein
MVRLLSLIRKPICNEEKLAHDQAAETQHRHWDLRRSDPIARLASMRQSKAPNIPNTMQQ